MKSYGATDIGKKRSVNQDYFYCSDEPVGCFPNLYIVADGMGGHKAGDKASSLAVDRFVELAAKTGNEFPFEAMKKIILQVNKEVYQLSLEQPAYEGMGTTFVLATVLGDKAYIMNTLDHSLVEEMVRAGELRPEESRNHPQKNIITRAVGVADDVEPDFFLADCPPGSQILLCSDGLTNMVDDEDLSVFLTMDLAEEEFVRKCIDEALFFGGLDNITVVAARREDGRDADAFVGLPGQMYALSETHPELRPKSVLLSGDYVPESVKKHLEDISAIRILWQSMMRSTETVCTISSWSWQRE